MRKRSFSLSAPQWMFALSLSFTKDTLRRDSPFQIQMKWKSNEQEQEEVVMTFPSHSHSQRTSHQGLTVGQACWVSHVI